MNSILVEILGYKLSYLEACAVSTSLLCIISAVKEKIATFPLGIVATILYFAVFYEFHLYSSMSLQVIFLAFNIYGLYKWTHPQIKSADKDQLQVSVCSKTARWKIFIIIILGTIVWGLVSSELHLWWPKLFDAPARFAYVDSFVLIASIFAQYLLAIKKLENWILWLIIDVVATILYLFSEAWFTAAFYAILIPTAISGWLEWNKSLSKSNI